MACVLRRTGHTVELWAREPEVAAAINRDAANPLFLKGVALVPGIRATTDNRELARHSDNFTVHLLLCDKTRGIVDHARAAPVRPQSL